MPRLARQVSQNPRRGFGPFGPVCCPTLLVAVRGGASTPISVLGAYSPPGIQIGISPRRIPIVTASVRVDAPSLSRIELMWSLTVCSEIPRRAAILCRRVPPPTS